MPTDPRSAPTSAPTVAPAAAGSAAEVVLRGQRLAVSTVRVPAERVVLRRRIVTEVRQVEVTVHREELEVLRLPLDAEHPGQPEHQGKAAGHSAPAGVLTAPLVIVLSEQVPVVQLRTHGYERVTVTVQQVNDIQELHEQVAREQIDVTGPESALR